MKTTVNVVKTLGAEELKGMKSLGFDYEIKKQIRVNNVILHGIKRDEVKSFGDSVSVRFFDQNDGLMAELYVFKHEQLIKETSEIYIERK
jgi:hypothetical protein